MTFTKYQFNNFFIGLQIQRKLLNLLVIILPQNQICPIEFIESLINKNYAVHAYQYTPQFDHQQLAIKTWKDFKNCRISLSKRIGASIPTIRIGHSLGYKLHLISPDGEETAKNLYQLVSITSVLTNQSHY